VKGDQRRQAILELLLFSDAVGIVQLAERFAVSHMTIRRDLELLSGHVTVRRGLVRLARSSATEPRYAAKQRLNAPLKALIARYAAEHFVQDGDVVLLEGGTTVTAMARHLRGKTGLTVVTNGLYTLNELARLQPEVTVVSTGGVLRDGAFTFVGPAAEQHLAGIHAKTLFASATGFTAGRGFTDPNPLEAQIRRVMVERAERVVMLLDSSKFGVVSLVTVASANGVDLLVTDTGAPEEELARLRQAGVSVHLVAAP
jgi:DeoR/GlpR family transcriptional regulator of sugar metabolism